MNRTHVDEGELVELQRDALGLFQAMDEFIHKHGDHVSTNVREELEDFRDWARGISDDVDILTEYVRYNRGSEGWITTAPAPSAQQTAPIVPDQKKEANA